MGTHSGTTIKIPFNFVMLFFLSRIEILFLIFVKKSGFCVSAWVCMNAYVNPKRQEEVVSSSGAPVTGVCEPSQVGGAKL